MRVALRLMSLWPGLPDLWLRGRPEGLATALAFSMLVNAALAASFVWPGRLSPLGTAAVWVAAGGLWCWSLWRTSQRLDELAPSAASPQVEALFQTAQVQYLRGQWREAESLARQILAIRPADLETRLLLAAVLRRTERVAEARRQLAEMREWEGAQRWEAEVGRQLALLSRSDDPAAAQAEPSGVLGNDTAQNTTEPGRRGVLPAA